MQRPRDRFGGPGGVPGGGPSGGPGGFSTSSTELAEAVIQIDSPRDFVPSNFRVEGTAFVRMTHTEFIKFGGQGHHEIFDSFVTEGFRVKVRVGDDEHEARVSVQDDRLHWSHEVPDATSGRLTITARLEGTVTESHTTTRNGQTTGHNEQVRVRRTDSVNVTVDREGPKVEVSEHEVTIGPPYQATIAGTAGALSGIEAIRWHLGVSEGSAENLTGDWSMWRAVIPLPDLRSSRTIKISARDRAGNEKPEAASIPIPADEDPPTLTLTLPQTNPSFQLWQEGGIIVVVRGTAEDNASKIETVRWRLNDGPETEANQTGDTWSTWEFDVGLDSPGTHTVAVWSKDLADNSSESEPDILLEIQVQELSFD